MSKPIIVCLCGSTKFKTAFAEANESETLAGRIVLSVGFFAHQLTEEEQRARITPAVKTLLDELHLRKIDLADEVLVLNVGNYIGTSTKRELWYARSKYKRIRWLEPVLVLGGVIDGHDLLDYIDSFFRGWEDWRAAGQRAAMQS